MEQQTLPEDIREKLFRQVDEYISAEYKRRQLKSAINLYANQQAATITNPAEYLPQQLSDEDIEKAEIELSCAQKSAGTLYPFIEKVIKGYKAAQQP